MIPSMDLQQAFRDAVSRSGQSFYAINKATGINPSVLSRFMQGKTLTTETIQRIASHLGYEIVIRKIRKGR